MEILTKISDVRSVVRQWKNSGLTVGLVPTMGFLHEGHQSLIKRAAEENDKVVVSVFVNPIQFAPNEDFESYPRDLDRDAKLCEETGAALIFHPDAEEMYGSNFLTGITMSKLTDGLCGKTRPHHFGGVCTVVGKLFNIVTPDKAYFGQKDAQQLSVINQMVRDLNFDIEIVGCPIVREKDGLAKSSRNTYLNSEERKAALILSKSLSSAKEMIENGKKNTAEIISETKKLIETEKLAKIDYVDILSWDNLEPMAEINGKVLMAVAVYIGKTRLIDNFITEV